MTYTTTTACEITDNHLTGRAILVNIGGVHLPAVGYLFEDAGLFLDDASGTWYQSTAEIVAARRQRAEAFKGQWLHAAATRRYEAETDAMEQAVARV